MSAPSKVIELVERFNEHLESYKKGNYNETQVRLEYINPFFEALGWDIANKQGYAEAYKDVVHEDAIKIAGATKAPDYCFRVGGIRKFFLEAKKPSVYIKEAIHPAYQLRRYAWSAKLPLSILTDFEEFAIYDCRIKPEKNDKPSKARILYMTFKEYPDRWEEISSIFSREAIPKGSFDKYSESAKRKRGTAEVDDVFLDEIESWRSLLAKNFALRNPKLTNRQLNEIVQKTVDRIIFLRICEDRGIENYGQLMSLQNGTNTYSRLCNIYLHADNKYNSGLFHFKIEKGRGEEPDRLSLDLNLDDKVLKDIFKRLYYPDSPYEFSVLPADILGQVYEQFLGKVIRLTSGHRAIVEEKPEVRKAGGVYYTPTYIVEYIVKNTVGKLLEKKTPKQAEKIKILDPACGSGSFLLGAYQYLLDWYLKQYTGENPEKQSKGKNPKICETYKGEWKLTTGEKKRILLNNIYGVDIDTQAVEVTKLSLLLRVLESETEQSLQSQLKLFHERALPDLGNNIKCGNSLIGSDYFVGKQATLFDEQEMYKVNAFDWEKEFAQIIKAGGFDAVIGNPPYIRIQAMKEWAPKEVAFYKNKYKVANTGNYDIYVVFVEKALNVLNEKGKTGFILPNKFLTTDYGQNLRKIISKQEALERLIDFRHGQVFEQATTYTCLLFLSGKKTTTFEHAQLKSSSTVLTTNLDFTKSSSNYLSEKPWIFMSNTETELSSKVEQIGVPLLELPTTISRGSSSGNDNLFMLKRTSKKNRYLAEDNEEVEIEDSIIKIPLFATDFSRYKFIPKDEKVIIFPYRFQGGKYILVSEDEMKKCFPKAFNYLYSKKKQLTKRKQFKEWYGFSAPRNLVSHDVAQMIVPLLANKGLLAELPKNKSSYCLMASGGFSISIKKPLSPRYILGLLNSSLLFWYLNTISNRFSGGWITCTKQYMGKLPIRTIDFSNSTEKSRHDEIVKLVDLMLELNKKASKTKSSHDKTVLQRQIEAADNQIDQLVYELYGLTEKEIKIVEEG